MMISLLFGMLTQAGQQKRFSIMGFGDSITEGGKGFSTYLYPLWEKLFAAGYEFDFIGPNKSECRIGTLANCGFRGKPVEFLDAITDSIYQKYPADMVLIHAGHNHHIDQKPIKGIINSYRSIITKMMHINPQVHIFLSTVTESGKLPKYGYIPELNEEIKKLVKELNNQQITLVDQNSTHNWRTMTIADKVHPNKLGRERMAGVWFEAIKPYLEEPVYHFNVTKMTYKKLPNGNILEAHVFRPEGKSTHSAIAWFFAGGWKYGSPLQFYRECAHYASLGMTAISFDYRIASKDSSKVEDAVADCKDAIQWLRAHAKEFEIDTNRIAVGGASAGGSMVALMGCNNPNNYGKASRPDLMILEYPTLSLSKNHLKDNMPPMILLMGTEDEFTSIKQVEGWIKKVRQMGNECEFHPFEGRHHPIFYYRKALTSDYWKMLDYIDIFLKKHAFI